MKLANQLTDMLSKQNRKGKRKLFFVIKSIKDSFRRSCFTRISSFAIGTRTREGKKS